MFYLVILNICSSGVVKQREVHNIQDACLPIRQLARPPPVKNILSTVWVAVTAEMLKQAFSAEREQSEAWQNVSIVTEEQG